MTGDDDQRLCLIRFINSSRVLACWKKPVKSEVVVKEFCFSTPRICMHMLRLDHDHHAQRVQGPLDAILDLHRHTLLYLETAGEDIHYPRDLA